MAANIARSHRDPDWNDFNFERKRGEFHIGTEMAFERHIRTLSALPKIEPGVEAYE